MLEHIGRLYKDNQQCAQVAGLTYIDGEQPGLQRRRHGRGWSYSQTVDGAQVAMTDQAVKARILALAIPPAWQKVWICPHEDGHILATGEDERGRKQYMYHPRWRELRDLLNFYRLIVTGSHLPAIRSHVEIQLRRRTVDRDQVLAVMVRIIDSSAMRIGNEVYAEENQSFGLSTLTRKHVSVHRDWVDFEFPAKSGKDASVRVEDRAVARIVGHLQKTRSKRLFTVDGEHLGSDDVNDLLHELTGESITAKDFRTWGGTLAAFEYLRDRTESDRKPETIVNEAIDEAAEHLNNTRRGARAHYVHPHVLETFTERNFEGYQDASRPRPQDQLTTGEQQLLAFLRVLLEREFSLDTAEA